MIRAAMILLVLVAPAQAASVTDRLHCWAYPHHERCRAPALAPEPIQAPAPPPLPAPIFVPVAPVVVPAAPPLAAPAVIQRKPVKARPRVKPKYKPAPVRKRMAATKVASWCARVPKGTTIGQIEFAAPMYGVRLTPANRRQAAACLASK